MSMRLHEQSNVPCCAHVTEYITCISAMRLFSYFGRLLSSWKVLQRVSCFDYIEGYVHLVRNNVVKKKVLRAVWDLLSIVEDAIADTVRGTLFHDVTRLGQIKS